MEANLSLPLDSYALQVVLLMDTVVYVDVYIYMLEHSFLKCVCQS